MNELRLLFDKTDDAYTVRLDNTWGGSPGTPLPFEPFLNDEDFEDLRWYLEDFMDLPDGGAVDRANRVKASIDAWGERLFQALFGRSENGELFEELLRRPAPRLLSIVSSNTDIMRLPWECIRNANGPLTLQAVAVRRCPEEAPAAVERSVALPLRILLIVSRPDDQGFIDPRYTTYSLTKAIEYLGQAAVVDFCRPPTVAHMQQMLADARTANTPYHVVHFDGHGTFLPEIELGALCFEKDDETPVQTDYARADRLGKVLTEFNIPLVILEACRSAQVAKTALFRSVAPRLIEAGVGSVVSMSHAVHVEAARILLERFYREVAAGASIAHALDQARNGLSGNPHRWIEPGPTGKKVELQDWFVPHLYQASENPSLVPPEDARQFAQGRKPPSLPAPFKFHTFISHSDADEERVEYIATRLREDYGLRVFLDKWEIKRGLIFQQCADGIKASQFLLLACTKKALESRWVQAEHDIARTIDPRGENVIPLLFDDIKLPPEIRAVCWHDFRNPQEDDARIAKLAEALGVERLAAEVRRERPKLPCGDEAGAFPPPPAYGFQGRAREMLLLERQFRSHRAILLHAMGGMGKTTLATEAAFWWTRTGLFPDGACFVSFEQFTSAERIVQVLGTYLEGNAFNSLPEAEQRKRATELFRDKGVLMVWDNFESVLPAFQCGDQPQAALVYGDEERGRICELFAEWTESPQGRGRVLVTCRPAEAGLTGARRTELHGLARPDSLWLLVRVLQTAGVDLDDRRLGRERLDKLLDVLADHPLSVELVGPHLKDLRPEEIIRDFGKLLEEFKRGAGRERNESLLASLAFSTGRLSPETRAALPWLGLFSGGVFEQILLDVSRLGPAQWDAARAELEATALVRVERDILLGKGDGRPYLRFHPTLAYAAADKDVPDRPEARKRFVHAYYAVGAATHKALGGSDPRGAMEVMQREEANFRTAVRRAVQDEQYSVAGPMGSTFRNYLERSGRLRERDLWVTWLAAEIDKGGFTITSATYERQQAWTLFTQGRAGEAIGRLEKLTERLRGTTEFDPAFQLASTQLTLGRVLDHSGQSQRAIPVLERGVAQWETLVNRAGDKHQAETERGNLSAALGDLANAFGSAGRLDEALAAAERALDINRDLGRDRQVAAALGLCARILMEQGRYGEADARYDEALAAARAAGDKGLEGLCLQHQGGLACNLRQYDRAGHLYQQALKRFQEMNDDANIMRSCNLLGTVEHNQGRLTEARTWYERSHEIAQRLRAVSDLAAAAQNIGIVCQNEGEAARKDGNEQAAQRRFQEAKRFLQESLHLNEQLGDEPDEALASGQLAQVHLLLGELDEAERRGKQCLQIDEKLGVVRELPSDYAIMAQIARARGDADQAAEWKRKRDAAREELRKRARGPGSGMPAQFAQAVQNLAVACARAAVEGTDLEPNAESALAQFSKLPAPMADVGSFLRRLADGELPAVPAGLPDELGQFLDQLLTAVKEAKP